MARFDPGTASRDMLSQMDIFKLHRVVSGHQALRDEVERGGVRGLLQCGGRAPQARPGGGPRRRGLLS